MLTVPRETLGVMMTDKVLKQRDDQISSDISGTDHLREFAEWFDTIKYAILRNLKWSLLRLIQTVITRRKADSDQHL